MMKCRFFKGSLFQVEESINVFLREEVNGFPKYEFQFATQAIEGETVIAAIYYTDY